MAKYSKWVGKKIEKIMTEGIRQNTRKPVSRKNPRRPVSRDKAIAVAINMAEKRGLKVPKRKKKKSPWGT